ncbi:hypothetical protein SprV_0702421800 [Sparganum proliferum]
MTSPDEAENIFYADLHAPISTLTNIGELNVLGNFNVCVRTGHAARRGELGLMVSAAELHKTQPSPDQRILPSSNAVEGNSDASSIVAPAAAAELRFNSEAKAAK